MANTNDLGIYPDEDAIDHDAAIFVGQATTRLVAAGASYEEALASLRRVLESHIA